jgi:E3 ubiquitin-protein ligase DOA10
MWYTFSIANLFMLSINTLKVAEHRGCKIYVRNFGTTFEYLTYVKGELYTAHMEIVPSIFRTFRKEKYTSKQLTDNAKYLINVAEATIDHVLDNTK